jgi:hypothetical protein
MARFAWTRADVDKRRAWAESSVDNVDRQYFRNIVDDVHGFKHVIHVLSAPHGRSRCVLELLYLVLNAYQW